MTRKLRCIALSESEDYSVFKTTPFGMTSLLAGSLYVVPTLSRNMIRATTLEKYRLLSVLRQARRLNRPACEQRVLQRFAAAVADRANESWSDFFGPHSSKSIAKSISLA